MNWVPPSERRPRRISDFQSERREVVGLQEHGGVVYFTDPVTGQTTPQDSRPCCPECMAEIQPGALRCDQCKWVVTEEPRRVFVDPVTLSRYMLEPRCPECGRTSFGERSHHCRTCLLMERTSPGGRDVKYSNWFDIDGDRAVVIRRLTEKQWIHSNSYSGRTNETVAGWLARTYNGWSIFAMVLASAVTIPMLFVGQGLTAWMIIPGAIWAVAAGLFHVGRRHDLDNSVGKQVGEYAFEISKKIPQPLTDMLNRAVKNTRTVFEQCSQNPGKAPSSLAMQADDVLKAMCDTASSLSEMLSIDKRNNDVKGCITVARNLTKSNGC